MSERRSRARQTVGRSRSPVWPRSNCWPSPSARSAAGLPFAVARDSFLVTNATLGAACAVSGALIAWHRPRNAVGWLLLGVAVAQTATAAVTPWLAQALIDGAPTTTLDALATVYSGAWPWAVALFLPLALWVFPDGRLPSASRGWRWGVGLVAANAVMQILLFSADAFPLATVDGFGPGAVPPARSWIAVPALESSSWWRGVGPGARGDLPPGRRGLGRPLPAGRRTHAGCNCCGRCWRPSWVSSSSARPAS